MVTNPGDHGGIIEMIVRTQKRVQSPYMSTLEIKPVSSFASSLYVSRDLSLLEFQRRVLEEAEDKENPLVERVKFLAIFGSNMD